MGIRDPIKHFLKMCGHAFSATVHDRLDKIEAEMAALAETQTSLLRAAIDAAEKQSHGFGERRIDAPEVALMSFLYSFLPDRTAVDIGAHVGDISEALLRTGYDVYAFEPNPPVYQALLRRLSSFKDFHAFPNAIGSGSGELTLHLVENRTEPRKYEDGTLYSSLRPHAMPQGLVFDGAVRVPVRSLADLHADGSLPAGVSLVKIDTEGFDLEVIRGMGDHRYPVVVAEYWDAATPFGAPYTLETLVGEMRARGYSWHIVLYRVWVGLEHGYYSNDTASMPNAWGNVFFFRDYNVFAEAQAWCSAEMPRRYPRAVKAAGTMEKRGCAPVADSVDAVVAHIEINDHHGVGVLLCRLFGASANIASVRSQNYYEGRQDFGGMNLCVADGASDRLRQEFADTRVRRILCVPYFAQDVRNALALREISNAPLCTYLMDDQNLFADGIPDALMKELLAKSDLRLAISPQLATAYQKKFGQETWFMPPVAPHEFLLDRVNQVPNAALREKSAVILGNIWGSHWVARLRETVRDSGIKVRWYNNGEFRWLPCDPAALAADGIEPQMGVALPDAAMIDVLRASSFVILPSGTLDESDDRRFIAELSLPSRIPYIFATSHAPILVLGSPDTAAAQFVVRHGIGMTAPYTRDAFRAAIERITQPDVNLEMRTAAFSLAARFSDLGAAEWIWRSLEMGRPADRRYEDLRS